MKREYLLLLTLLLSQSAPVWGMEEREDGTSATYHSTARATSLPAEIENLHNIIQEPTQRTHENPNYQNDSTRVDTGRGKASIDHKKIIDVEAERNDMYFASALNNAETAFLPIEIKVYILSFLDQRNLLKVGGICKSWREATQMIWENKPLNLPNRSFSPNDCKIFAHGPFSSLIFKSIQSDKEASEEDGQLTVGVYQLLSVQNRTNEWVEKWQKLDKDPNLKEITARAEQQVYQISRITGGTKQEALQEQEPYDRTLAEGAALWVPVLPWFVWWNHVIRYRTVIKYITVPLPDLWHVQKVYRAARGSAANGNPGNGLNTNGQQNPPPQTPLNKNAINQQYKEYVQQQSLNPNVKDFIQKL